MLSERVINLGFDLNPGYRITVFRIFNFVSNMEFSEILNPFRITKFNKTTSGNLPVSF